MRNNLPNKAIPQPHWMLHGVMVLIPNSRWPELQVALIPSIPTFSPSQRYSQGCCRKVVWKDSISYSARGIRGFSPSVPLLASRSATYQELCFAHFTVSSVDISSSLFIADIPPQKIVSCVSWQILHTAKRSCAQREKCCDHLLDRPTGRPTTMARWKAQADVPFASSCRVLSSWFMSRRSEIRLALNSV